jgi:hypothetical protein
MTEFGAFYRRRMRRELEEAERQWAGFIDFVKWLIGLFFSRH